MKIIFKNKIFGALLFFFVSSNILAQNSFNYELSLVPVNINNLTGLHSYSHAQHNGKWLIIGGRKDGLHPRQPNSSFPSLQNNTDIYVIDVATSQFWSSSVNSLSSKLREQLQSTNMNFYQDEDTLYIIGGYGFSVTANNHITYPYLTSVNVSGLINAIINNQNISSYFKQIEDTAFAVTGGHLKKINDTFYLVGGHKFDGRYNPNNNPTYTQTYTNQIRKFKINNSGTQLSISNYSTITDAVHLHRRDYNLLPYIFADGEEGLLISSGVFQVNVDLPYLYPVEIRENSYTPITSFNQYLSNYHSANVNLFDSINNEMHSIFFGGMSQYYYQNGNLIQDNQVPFVKTISRISRDASGNLSEHLMQVEMPGLKGSSAEFITNKNLPRYKSNIIKLSAINQNSFLIGHIYGGINSSALNPFSNNQTNLTNADNIIYEVWLTKKTINNDTKIDFTNPYDITIFPVPFENEFTINFNLNKPTRVAYYITNQLGQIVQSTENIKFDSGKNKIQLKINENSGIFYVTVVFDNEFYVTKKINKY